MQVSWPWTQVPASPVQWNQILDFQARHEATLHLVTLWNELEEVYSIADGSPPLAVRAFACTERTDGRVPDLELLRVSSPEVCTLKTFDLDLLLRIPPADPLEDGGLRGDGLDDIVKETNSLDAPSCPAGRDVKRDIFPFFESVLF